MKVPMVTCAFAGVRRSVLLELVLCETGARTLRRRYADEDALYLFRVLQVDELTTRYCS
jgi:hypothetical protein